MVVYSASVGLRGMHEDSALVYERKGAVHAWGGPTVSV